MLGEFASYIAVVNDPPWTTLSASVPEPVHVINAWDMEIRHLERTVASLASRLGDTRPVVVGIGGGTAMDTAKFISWTLSLPLVQVPTIISVDAAFTDAVGVRDGGRVRYVGTIAPELVVVDLDLISSAPKHLNRAGIGDVLSCHTGLHDWNAAALMGAGPAWDPPLAALGTSLLAELADAVDDIAAVTPAGLRFLADAYRRIGAACAGAGHSRFEEGSEHFWAYAYEHATGAHHVHGELISFATVALAHVQGNDADFAHRIVSAASTVAHPADLGIEHDRFVDTLLGLRAYARSEDLDVGIADLREISRADADAAWTFASTLPRRTEGGRFT